MKDKDFDDIGKRLHDLEADPPKGGWKKIATTINSPGQSGKLIWLRRNWWKPLVILIPVSVYLIYTGQRGAELASSISQNKNLSIERDSVNTSSAFAETKGEKSTVEKPEKKSSTVYTITEESNDKSASVIGKQGTSVTEKGTSETYPAKDATSAPVLESKISGGKPFGQNNLVIDLETESGKAAKEQLKAAQNNQDELPVTTNQLEYDISKSEEEIIAVYDDEKLIDQDSSHNNSEKKESKKKSSDWRLTAMESPQYSTKTVTPVTGDEMLVTDIDDNHLERIGFGFAIGAGKSVTPNLYVDGQLSYVVSDQVVNYSYTNGKVDTLLAMQQPDQSVLVTPVYQISNSEISTKYGYGGIRLGATYYFWTTQGGRFNLAASAGAHYLMSSQVKEKINGQWISLSDENMSKVNYSFIIGVGYNINLSKGWELMINPALTYYLREIQDDRLPYNLNQQSFGLNIMLSKTLGVN